MKNLNLNKLASTGLKAAGMAKQELDKKSKQVQKLARGLGGGGSEPHYLQVQGVELFEVAPREVTLCWNPLDLEDEVEYRVKYHQDSMTIKSWVYCEVTRENGFTVTNLKPKTLYTFYVQAKEVRLEFGPPSIAVETRTGTLLHEERQKNISRAECFISPEENFTAYPEPLRKPDTLFNKAERGFNGALNLASFVGLGGMYVGVVKKLYKVRKVGISAVIFSKDLSGVVLVLGSQLVNISKRLGMSTRDVMIGTYYHIWESKKLRVNNPALEFETHQDQSNSSDITLKTVLLHKCPEELLKEFATVLTLARLPYRAEPHEVQWVLHKLSPPVAGYQLVCQRGTSGPQMPAFCVFANEAEKKVFLSIRGTAEVEDLLTNHSFATVDVSLNMHGEQVVVKLHHGFFQAAKWILSSGLKKKKVTHSAKTTQTFSKDDLQDIDGAGMFEVVKRFADAGYTLNLVGHSLGAGVSSILGILLANILDNVKINMYGYATPCAVDAFTTRMLTSSSCKRRGIAFAAPESTPAMEAFFTRLNYVNFVKRDDIVPRLSMYCLKRCALEIKRSKPVWSQYATEDAQAAKKKAITFWAPNQRGMAQEGDAGKQDLTEEEIEESVQAMEEEVLTDQKSRQYVAGPIIHAYRHNGIDEAAIVTSDFEDFNKIMAFESLKHDHLCSTIASCMQEIFAGRKASERPPEWQPGEINAVGEVTTKCGVCGYFVGWNSALGTTSGAQETKSSLHCHSCGKIVCPSCANQKAALQRLGISRPVRICDTCNFQYSFLGA